VALGPKGTSHFGFSLSFFPAFYWTLCLFLLFIFNGWPSLIPLLFRSRGLLIFAPASAPQVARNSGFVPAANLVKKILVLLTFGQPQQDRGWNPDGNRAAREARVRAGAAGAAAPQRHSRLHCRRGG